MAVASIFVQWYTAKQGYVVRTQQTAVFTTLCFIQLGNALSVRSVYHSMFSIGLFANKGLWGAIISTVILQLCLVYVPFLQTIFKTTSLTTEIIGTILIVTLVCIVFIELLKYLNKKKYLKASL
jgi:Ca2+-transporting ATPase